jgi:hypothetical protein
MKRLTAEQFFTKADQYVQRKRALRNQLNAMEAHDIGRMCDLSAVASISIRCGSIERSLVRLERWMRLVVERTGKASIRDQSSFVGVSAAFDAESGE